MRYRPEKSEVLSNSKLSSFLKRKGEYLASGCERAAFEYAGKVYKVPFEYNVQGSFEQDIISMLPEEFRVFFPNPQFFGRVCQMDYVIIASDADWDCEATERYENRPQGWNVEEYSTLHDFAYAHQLKFDVDLFNQFLQWIQEQGGNICDILENDGNYGYDPKTMELKIIDWGWSSRDSYGWSDC